MYQDIGNEGQSLGLSSAKLAGLDHGGAGERHTGPSESRFHPKCDERWCRALNEDCPDLI